MATQLTGIIYGKDKKIDLKKFNVGNLTKAVAYDLKEFDRKGVQGVVVKQADATRTITYCAAAKLKSPYVMAGLVKDDLVLVVRDAGDDRFEQMAVLVKDYAGVKKGLAESTAAIVNAGHGDGIIDRAAGKLAKKFGAEPQDLDDADFGDVTGDVLLSAHGTPKINAGRVIGVDLGKMSVKQVCDLLTRNRDKSKRLAKDYSGKVTLSACFTASGGPEAYAKDDAFAKKVHDELKKRGFTKCSVVGIPGVLTTARAGQRDDDRHAMKAGDHAAWTRSEELLAALDKKAKPLRAEIDKLTDGLIAAAGKSSDTGKSSDKSTFLATAPARKILATIATKEKALQSLKGEMQSIQADQAKYGDVDGKLLANVEGNFGLRVVQSSLGRG